MEYQWKKKCSRLISLKQPVKPATALTEHWAEKWLIFGPNTYTYFEWSTSSAFVHWFCNLPPLKVVFFFAVCNMNNEHNKSMGNSPVSRLQIYLHCFSSVFSNNFMHNKRRADLSFLFVCYRNALVDESNSKLSLRIGCERWNEIRWKQS